LLKHQERRFLNKFSLLGKKAGCAVYMLVCRSQAGNPVQRNQATFYVTLFCAAFFIDENENKKVCWFAQGKAFNWWM